MNHDFNQATSCKRTEIMYYEENCRKLKKIVLNNVFVPVACSNGRSDRKKNELPAHM